MEVKHTLALKILEAYTRDVGRGVARIDYDSMDTLNASTGDIIEIKGKRRTVAKCLPLYPSDEDKKIIRVDGLKRINAGVVIGDTIEIKTIKSINAEKVVVAPLEAIPPIDERYLADALEEVPIIKKDFVMVPYFGGRLTFQVIHVEPTSDATIVTKKTVFEIAENKSLGTNLITFDEICGLAEEIKELRLAIELPLKHPELFEGVEKSVSKILLYGPDGCGKTSLVRAVAEENNIPFHRIFGSEIAGKCLEDISIISSIFEDVSERSPCIFLIDEIEKLAKNQGIASDTDKVIASHFLSCLESFDRNDVIVVGLTDEVGDLDPKFLKRAGFDKQIPVNLPTKDARMNLFALKTSNLRLGDDVDIPKLAEKTEEFTGADIELICKNANEQAIRRLLPELNLEEKIPPESLDKLVVSQTDFEEVIEKFQTSKLVYCKLCNQNNPLNSFYCNHCGKKLKN